MNFISKYYKSINKEKKDHTIVNLLFSIIIFFIFYTIAKISFNKIKNANIKKITKDKINEYIKELKEKEKEKSKD